MNADRKLIRWLGGIPNHDRTVDAYVTGRRVLAHHFAGGLPSRLSEVVFTDDEPAAWEQTIAELEAEGYVGAAIFVNAAGERVR